MKSERERAVQTYATFRVSGDNLDPRKVTKILKLTPTLAYAKGELYSAGPRSPKLRGRTGVWYFSTKRVISSDELADHLWFIISIIDYSIAKPPLARFCKLQDLISTYKLRALATCFWSGPSQLRRPTIPAEAMRFMKSIPAEIAHDFEDDPESPLEEPQLAHA
jgi:hypothetical protein